MELIDPGAGINQAAGINAEPFLSAGDEDACHEFDRDGLYGRILAEISALELSEAGSRLLMTGPDY